MTSLPPSIRRILRGVGYGVSVVAPVLLLFDRQIHFQQDWPSHLWIIDYFAAYFRQHGTSPEFMNPVQAVGMALPVFYGVLLYPILGLFVAGAGLGPGVGLAVGVLILVQFWAVLSAGRRVFGHPRLAYVVAASVIWSTYSLTNLYNRGAIAEFFGTGFFFAAIGFGTSAALAVNRGDRWFNGWLAVLFSLLAVGAHPPTAVLAAIFLLILAVGWLGARWRAGVGIAAADKWLVAAAAGAGALILAPWVYACGLYSGQLVVTRHFAKFVFHPDHSDTFLARFSLLPYDVSSAVQGIHAGDTPFLEAPVNMVLVALLLWNVELWRRDAGRLEARSQPRYGVARILLILSAGWFGLLAAISLSPGLASHFEFFAPWIQFVYRLVSHCNAALLIAVFASGLIVARLGGYRRHRHQTDQVLTAVLVVAVLGLGLKLQHGAAVAEPGAPVPPSIGQQLALATGYSTLSVRALPESDGGDAPMVMFAGQFTTAHWGEIGAIRVGLKQGAWLRTNAMAFPWLEMTCDGVKLPAAQVAREGPFYAIFIPAGRHELRPVWRPDPVWSALRRVSQVSFALALLFTVGWATVRQFTRRAAGTAI